MNKEKTGLHNTVISMSHLTDSIILGGSTCKGENTVNIRSTEMPDFLDMKMKEKEEIIDLSDAIYEEIKTDNISEELLDHFRAAGIDVDNMDEGLLGTLVGGLTGFFIGPSVGRLIARALGVTKGVLFDMFNSKLVGTALGVAIMKTFKKRKK